MICCHDISHHLHLHNQFQKVNNGRFRHRRKSSVEINNDIFLNKLNVEDDNHSAIQDVTNSSSAPHQLQDSSQMEQQMRENWAATHIQTAFRGFLVLFVFNIVVLSFCFCILLKKYS